MLIINVDMSRGGQETSDDLFSLILRLFGSLVVVKFSLDSDSKSPISLSLTDLLFSHLNKIFD